MEGSSLKTGRAGIGGAPEHGPQQQLNIFCAGRICTWDVTEIQARAIICMARRDMDERMKKSRRHDHRPLLLLSAALPNPGLSMKSSLQRFLQKRKTRTHPSAASPYSRHPPPAPSPPLSP